MDTSDQIAHQGIVTNRYGDKAVIQLMQAGSCHSCHMKDFCGVDDDERSRFEVSDSNLEIGDHVNVEISPASGFLATFWAYIFPFILMFVVIAGGSVMGLSEAILGTVALLLLVPYYLLLSAFRKHFSNHLHLHISKL